MKPVPLRASTDLSFCLSFNRFRLSTYRGAMARPVSRSKIQLITLEVLRVSDSTKVETKKGATHIKTFCLQVLVQRKFLLLHAIQAWLPE
jgi:hypothetical protein